ncbi:MarR family winged helix-turn-helix transcriptional regulator [Streptacidiphilus rugosus]|uniref:MarR family winged helix-turn-helix transcriptional regulator n=1 Tax=Streptacidiphilus rugosus TaxID=405783 RepID=UPI00055B4B3B|nr:MarR family transcriptional regulator [Streptacidiphilus rugosus]
MDSGGDAVDRIMGQWAQVRPDLETEVMELFARVHRCARGMGERMETAYQAYGISRGEFDVLATLRRAGEPYTLSPRELTATLMLTSGGMTGRLDRLEKAGLVRRSPDPHDRRGLRVTLTPAGLDLLDRAVTGGAEVQRRSTEQLTPDQIAQLNGLLRRLLAGVDAM